MIDKKQSVVEEARELLAKITPEPLTFIRYEHGGGRLYQELGRTLVADFYDVGNREFYRAAPRLVDELVREVERLESVVTELQPINNAEVSALRVALTEMTAKFRACAIHAGSDAEFVDAAIEAICGAACPVHQM